MKTKLSGKFWLVLTVFSLMGQIAWVVENMYFNVFIYNMFSASATDIANMVAASAVAATLTTVFMGALSDRIGKRKIFICGGYILWGVSILAFTLVNVGFISKFVPVVQAASVGVSLTIILDCVMTFFGSTANDAAFNAWLTDSTDNTNRGAAEGINAMMPLVAILVVFGGFMAFDLTVSGSWTVIFTIIGLLTIAVGIMGCFVIKDNINIKPSDTGYFQNIFYGFCLSTVKKNPKLYKNLGLFVVFNIAIQIFMPYLIIYYEKSLGMADYVLIMAPAIIIASVVTAFWGRFYDKNGFLRSSLMSMAWLILGFFILYLFKQKLPVFIGSLLMMCGYLSGMAVFGAAIRDYTPIGKAGRLQGIRIFSQVLLPGVIGPYIGKTVLRDAKIIKNSDGTESFLPNENIFLAALIVAAIVVVLVLLLKDKKPPHINTLTTPFEKDLTDIPLTDYPRPQLVRDSYLCLNGKWDFKVENGEKELYNGDILVPFPIESKLSGVAKTFESESLYIYSRRFSLPQDFRRDRVILHFGAVDQEAQVYINGSFVGANIGGYIPFQFDITDYLNEKDNIIRVEVTDSLDTCLPYGKQTEKRGGMWYTKVSGIWQTVWLESVYKKYIESIQTDVTENSVNLTTVGGENEKQITIFTQNGEKTYNFIGDSIKIEIENPVCWTPENPYIYRFTISSGNDRIDSYFALRTISTKTVNGNTFITLNGKPYFFNGLLDQGYFSDGIFLPATYEGYKNDILVAKKLGFNMLRKHIKIEPQIFYYYCDIYGMAVFQDAVNNGKYSFFRDTALPTVGFKKLKKKAPKECRERFLRCAEDMIKLLYNHPSVCYYTIFNEGWGQHDSAAVYRKLKELDGSRIYDTASGWFKEEKSDVVSEHVYFKPVKLKASTDKPLILSEFGGYCFKSLENSFNKDKTFGYKKCATAEDFERDLRRLYREEVLPAVKQGLNATVLTQLSDVEDETNGLLTYDRQIVKLSENSLATEFKAIKEEFEKVATQHKNYRV